MGEICPVTDKATGLFLLTISQGNGTNIHRTITITAGAAGVEMKQAAC